MSKSKRSTILDLKDAIANEIAPIHIVNDYIGKFTEEAGQSRPKYIDISYDELFKITHALTAALNNVEKIFHTFITVTKK